MTVSGFASSVTSASGATSNADRQVPIIEAISAGSRSDGVPPPKKIVSAGEPSPARAISWTTADTYRSFNPASKSPRLKLQ